MTTINKSHELNGKVSVPKSALSLVADYGIFYGKFFISAMLAMIASILFALTPLFSGENESITKSILSGIYGLLTLSIPTIALVCFTVFVCTLFFNKIVAEIIVPKAIGVALKLLSPDAAIDYIEKKIVDFYDYVFSKTPVKKILSKEDRLNRACIDFILRKLRIDTSNIESFATKDDFSDFIRVKIKSSMDDLTAPDYTKYLIIMASPWASLIASIIIFS